MPTKPRSAGSSKRLRAAPKRSGGLGRRLVKAAREVLAYRRGELALESYDVEIPEIIDVAALRAKLGLSQQRFAAQFGLDVTAVHAWEQGRRRPDRAARVLLTVIAKEPAAVRRALTPV
jgi:putative transcriptional regulator